MTEKETQFNYAYKKYHGNLVYCALQVVGNQEDAQDVVEGVYLKLWVRHEWPEDEFNYLYTMTINYSRNWIRTNDRAIKRHNEVVRRSEYVENDLWIKAELVSLINKNIESLPSKRKQIFKLYAVDGYSVKEIMDLLGLKEGGVCTQIKRARDFIFEQVKNAYPEYSRPETEQEKKRRLLAHVRRNCKRYRKELKWSLQQPAI